MERRRSPRLDGVSEAVLSRGDGASIRGAIFDLSTGGLHVSYLQPRDGAGDLVAAVGDALQVDFGIPRGEVHADAKVVATQPDHLHLQFTRIRSGGEALKDFLESPIAGSREERLAPTAAERLLRARFDGPTRSMETA